MRKGGSVVSDIQGAIRWQTSVPIFENKVILKQLGIGISIPFGLVALVIALVSGRSRDALYALGLIAGLLVLTWPFIMTAYRGKYRMELVLDNKGALCRTQTRQAKENRAINTLTVLLGLLLGKPAVAGSGMLAQLLFCGLSETLRSVFSESVPMLSRPISGARAASAPM